MPSEKSALLRNKVCYNEILAKNTGAVLADTFQKLGEKNSTGKRGKETERWNVHILTLWPAERG